MITTTRYVTSKNGRSCAKQLDFWRLPNGGCKRCCVRGGIGIKRCGDLGDLEIELYAKRKFVAGNRVAAARAYAKRRTIVAMRIGIS